MLKSAPNELQESNEGIESVVGYQVFKAVQQNDSVFGFLQEVGDQHRQIKQRVYSSLVLRSHCAQPDDARARHQLRSFPPVPTSED
jgi:hypothetical protein